MPSRLDGGLRRARSSTGTGWTGRTAVAVFAMGPRSLDVEQVASSREQLDARARKEADPRAVLDGRLRWRARFLAAHFPFNRMPAVDARDWEAIGIRADDVARHLTQLAAEHEPAAAVTAVS